MKTYEELMYELEERKVMSVLQRRKKSIFFSRLRKNSAIQAKIARTKKKIAPNSKILQRANKAAKQIIIKKFAGLHPNKYANLSMMQKQMIDNKIVSKKAGSIKKIAKRLIVKLKKAELERLKKAREIGNQ